MGRDNVIWLRQLDWHDQKGQIYNIFLAAIIIKILNRKGLKMKKKIHFSSYHLQYQNN
jgi:hypothetical protein